MGGVAAPPYLTAAEALDAGTLSIGEMGGGSVPQLVLKNAGTLPVLLLDGEHLEGAMQNRVLNATVLAAPDHETVIPVSCVERGRWGYRGPSGEYGGFSSRARDGVRGAPRDEGGGGGRLDPAWRRAPRRPRRGLGRRRTQARPGARRELAHRRDARRVPGPRRRTSGGSSTVSVDPTPSTTA